MGTYMKIAWRNIWRNKRRTLILMSAIAVGLAGLLISIGFTRGWASSSINTSLDSLIYHIQIQGKGFETNPAVDNNFKFSPDIKKALSETPGIEGYSLRTEATGLISNARYSGGAKIIGVDPDQEKKLTVIDDHIIAGSYFGSGTAKGIVIGKELADKMQTEVGKKVVLTAGDANNQGAYDAFRVAGIYAINDPSFEELHVFIPLQESQNMLAVGGNIHEVAIRLNPDADVDQISETLRENLGRDDLEVLTWKQIMPILTMMMQMIDESVGIYYVIIFIAMAFGIINAFLMAVFERVKEIGVMMAIGMKPRNVIFMVLLESLMLGLIAIVIGILIGWAFNSYYAINGLDMTWAAEGSKMWKMGTRIYPETNMTDVITSAIAAAIAMIVMTLYPAWKASRFNPVEAISQY